MACESVSKGSTASNFVADPFLYVQVKCHLFYLMEASMVLIC